MNTIRTSSLFHYTDYNTLKRILVDGLVPNYCLEDLSVDDTDFALGIPMICFCDIPLTKTEEFSKQYGNFAIGLSKDWGLRNRINPVFYASDSNIIISVRFYRSYEQSLRGRVEQAGGNIHSLNINFNDPNSVQNIVPFINLNKAYSANRSLFGYLKRYESEWKRKPYINYNENEWRFVIGESEQTPWFWTREDYMNWRGDTSKKKPEPPNALQSHKLVFEATDVSHIIVQNEDQVARIIDFIDSGRFDHIGGNMTVPSDRDKKTLISRIISQERIAKDF